MHDIRHPEGRFRRPVGPGLCRSHREHLRCGQGAGGFVDHAGTGRADWGARVPPRFSDGFEKRTVGRLSIWEDIDAVSIFAPQGVHSEALHKRPEWFEPSEHPDHVGWRIDEDHIPTWAEACERL
ncbi:MAG: hypothetical protein CME19_14270 [Gemmatimonadetes bacterium]|nr:hypothetical protein [Gemmatimonadota bacterium]